MSSDGFCIRFQGLATSRSWRRFWRRNHAPMMPTAATPSSTATTIPATAPPDRLDESDACVAAADDATCCGLNALVAAVLDEDSVLESFRSALIARVAEAEVESSASDESEDVMRSSVAERAEDEGVLTGERALLTGSELNASSSSCVDTAAGDSEFELVEGSAAALLLSRWPTMGALWTWRVGLADAWASEVVEGALSTTLLESAALDEAPATRGAAWPAGVVEGVCLVVGGAMAVG